MHLRKASPCRVKIINEKTFPPTAPVNLHRHFARESFLEKDPYGMG